jgi:hypothetical protein
MKLICPDGVGSINVAGTEYTAKGGVVEIHDPVHVAAAQANGFTEAEPTNHEAHVADPSGE